MKKLLLGVLLASGLAGAAAAAPVYPVGVVPGSINQPGPVAPERSDPAAMWDQDVNTFYSLGLGGSIILDFGRLVTSPGSVTEVTFRLAGYVERLRILVSSVTDDASFTQVATIENDEAQAPSGATLTFASAPFRYVKLVDFSPVRAGRDGFDVAEISFSPVPVPAAGLLLGGALLGAGALRRRKAKKA